MARVPVMTRVPGAAGTGRNGGRRGVVVVCSGCHLVLIEYSPLVSVRASTSIRRRLVARAARSHNVEVTRPIRIGIQLPEVEREVRWPEMLDLARAIEDLGFDAIWLGEHLLYRWPNRPPRGPWEAWTMMAALAAATSRVTIGPLVACTAFHNPALLAKQAATIDEVSGGRFIFGLGAGWNETEFRAFGFPFDQRIARFEEAFTIIRTLLREGTVNFDGRFYQARDCELLPRPRPGGPPLLIGSNGPRMLRIAAPHVDAWNTWYSETNNKPEGVAALREVVDAACRDVGRDPGEIARTVVVHVRMPGGTGRTMGDDTTSARIAPLEGTPEHIASGLAAYASAGVSEVQVVLDPIDRRSVEAFAAVLPFLDRA